MQILIIRGLPGSGKSTLAKKYMAEAMARGQTVEHLEADMFFVDADGNYEFNPQLLPMAHKHCQERYKRAIEQNVDLIIVSNTFTQAWEIQPYYDMYRDKPGGAFNIEHVETDLTNEELAARNVHDVPATAIARMRARWEPTSDIVLQLMDTDEEVG